MQKKKKLEIIDESQDKKEIVHHCDQIEGHKDEMNGQRLHYEKEFEAPNKNVKKILNQTGTITTS